MTASASGKAPRQSRTRKPTTPQAAPVAEAAPVTKPVPKPRARKAPAKAEPAAVAVVETATEPVTTVDLRTPAQLDAEVAVTAYLMWEQGTPGDAAAHWYAAEALVRS